MIDAQDLFDSHSTAEQKEPAFQLQRNSLIKSLKGLPPTEFHYYFLLLLSSIENEKNPQRYLPLVIKSIELVDKLKQFYKQLDDMPKSDSSKPTHPKPDLSEITNALASLIHSSTMNNIPRQIKMAAINLCSIITGFIMGAVGAVVGFAGGLFLSKITLKDKFYGPGLGLFAGLVIGALACSHLPNLIAQSSFERKLQFCLYHIEKVVKELPDKKSHKFYQERVKQKILQTFFATTPATEKEAAFTTFLNTNQSFALHTTTAGFISFSLKGYLGHHSLIAYSINGVQHYPIEYGDRAKTPNFFDQSESPARIVTGQKLFDMLVLDEILQETYKYSALNFIKHYDIGNEDCRSYINKILLGTGQVPTPLPRFSEQKKEDKIRGKHIVGALVRFFGKISEQELDPIVPEFQDPNNKEPVHMIQRIYMGKEIPHLETKIRI